MKLWQYKGTLFLIPATVGIGVLVLCSWLVVYGQPASDRQMVKHGVKHRIIVSTDIGGTDPDDFQSMTHLMMYSDLFQVEGLISSPFGGGRKHHLLDMIDLYEEDFAQLRRNNPQLTSPDVLRSVCKQGAIESAPYKGYASPSEGSEWIIKCAKRNSSQPLWVLVWGGLEDLAQALHDAPEIEPLIRVFWIGGPNKKWSVNAYHYIVEHHPNLWMIESNATYRGWFMEDENAPIDMHEEAYYERFIRGRGALGADFVNHYNGHIKMGDTPSLAYLIEGDVDNPEGDSWGGRYTPVGFSSRKVFYGHTTLKDSVPAYGVIEWRFEGPVQPVPPDSVCFTMEIQGQVWPGYYLGDGIYAVRYSSKRPEVVSYVLHSDIGALDGHSGECVSTAPWPGPYTTDDYEVGKHWYGDLPDARYFLDGQQGARTLSRHRRAFLMDWAARWDWLQRGGVR